MSKEHQFRKDDPGFGERYSRKTKRVINPDGTFNVIKKGTQFSFRDAYLMMVNMSWKHFLGMVVLIYLGINAFFACIYLVIGVENLLGGSEPIPGGKFLNAFFFSVQTFTTVGYGGMSPSGLWCNIVASIEALCGLLGFALASGLLYGRFSKPSARIKYSKNLLIAPFRGESALMFRMANFRRNLLLNIEVQVMVMFTDRTGGEFKRSFFELELERKKIYFFPLTWTVVHAIDTSSPLYGKTVEDFEKEDIEILVSVKGFDDTFSQEVHSRYSYKFQEFVYGAKFLPAFTPDEEGNIVLDLDKLDDFAPMKIELKTPELP
ncbi:MAG: hypothetical protein H6581_29490 [Bacteroidia bacterium]|nr:hypothetical protein [Bacteroidia bacterium]